MGGRSGRWTPLVALALAAFVALGTAVARRVGPSHDAVAAASAPITAPGRPPARTATAPLALPARPRVIVFAPHPDDETIAVGGLLARLARTRTPLRVVFMTNGDGYPRAVETDFGVARPTDSDYVAFGELRQREARAALAHLGVARRDVRFLGFPDGGLAELWRLHWLPSHPYTSPYTGESSPPEPEGIGYDGQDLKSVVMRILRDFRPNVVVMPHPYDRHLDHAYTAYFVTEALAELEAAHVLPARPTALTYIVHHPWWPATQPANRERLRPLDAIPDSAWVERDVTAAELEAKRAALAEYESQLEVMGGFLRSFLAKNELFATVDRTVLDRIASIH
jgi:LmbE family N-acetylglucosaminyl deacetylase